MSITCLGRSFFALLLLQTSTAALAFNYSYAYVLSHDTLIGVEANAVSKDSQLNPNNQTLAIFDSNARLDLRPVYKLTFNEIFKLDLRPRLEIASGQVTQNQEKLILTKHDFWLNEGFVSIYPTDYLSAHLGRQSFLWGPSEVVGPSNPFYPDVLNRPNPLFQLRGRQMGRINLNIGSHFNIIALAELESLDDADFEMRYPEREKNLKRTLIKGEFTTLDGGFNLGLTYGKSAHSLSPLAPQESANFIGGYVMWTLTSALQIYSDFRLDQVDDTLYPYYVAGFRYTTLGGLEVRNEFIKKELGADATERKLLLSLWSNPAFSEQLGLFSKGQQDNLFSEEYYYFSLRKTFDKFSALKAPTLGIRSLYCLDYPSGLLSTFVEGGLTDSLTLTMYAAGTYGKDDGDFKQISDSQFGVFLKHSL